MAWTRFLVRAGALDEGAEQRYLGFCHQYVAGTLDIHAMHRASMAPLAAFTPAQLQAWRAAFARRDADPAAAGMRALVAMHLERGDLCAIVTATSRWVAEPFARPSASTIWWPPRPSVATAGPAARSTVCRASASTRSRRCRPGWPACRRRRCCRVRGVVVLFRFRQRPAAAAGGQPPGRRTPGRAPACACPAAGWPVLDTL